VNVNKVVIIKKKVVLSYTPKSTAFLATRPVGERGRNCKLVWADEEPEIVRWAGPKRRAAQKTSVPHHKYCKLRKLLTAYCIKPSTVTQRELWFHLIGPNRFFYIVYKDHTLTSAVQDRWMVTVFLGTDVNIFLSARAKAPIHSSPPYVAGETRGNWDTRVSMRLADGVGARG